MADPRYDPMGELAGPLPIPPQQPAASTGGGLPFDPSLISEPPGATPAASPGMASSQAQQQMERLQRIQANPLYRFGTALSGDDYIGRQLSQAQARDLQERQFQAQQEQFLTNKKLTLGTMAMNFMEKVATAKPEQRAALVEIGGQFMGPLLKEIGFDLPVNLLAKMADTPGLATQFGALISDYFQDQGSQKAILGEIANLDAKDVPGYIANRWKMAQDAALPKVQKALTWYAQRLRSDKGLMARLGLLDENGKPRPIPGQVLMGQVDEVFKTSAERAAAMRVLGTAEHSPFLASIGVQPGTLAEDQMKILGAAEAKMQTPQGQAEQRTALATATKAEAEAGVAGRKATAETTKAEAEAADTTTRSALLKTQLEETRLKVKQLEQETGPGGKVTNVAELRKEFTALPTVKSFQEVRDAYGRFESAFKNQSAAGDVSMIYAYMKMLDPGSVVRESEFATAQNAAGVPERIRNLYNRVLSGDRLTPEQRKDFDTQAGGVMRSHVTTLEETEAEFRRLAKLRGMDPGEVVPDLAGRFRKVPAAGPPKPEPPKRTGEPTRVQ